MKNENDVIQDHYLYEKYDQKKLNSTLSSDTIKILSLLKSYPSTATSSSFQIDNKQNFSSFNTNNLENNNYDNLSYDEIKAICLKIFMYYAKPIKGQFYLSQRYIFQILKEMEILNENCLSYVDIEILNQQINKKGDKLNSEQFLDLLAKICCLLDDSFYKDKKASFIKLIKLYIGPYLQKKNKNEINISNNINNDDINLNLNFKDLIINDYKLDKDSFDILMSIVEGLKIIYKTYFSLSEISSNKDISLIHKDSFNIFIKFLKDFEIIPYLIKQRLAELYWSIIISIDINELYIIYQNNENENIFKSFLNNKKYNLGKIYIFKKFFLLFSHISFYYFNSIKSKTKGQKLLYFIEKIYRSKGYNNMPNLYNKTFSKRYSIIPPLSIVERVNKNKIDNKNISNLKEEKTDNKDNLKNFIELNDETFKLLDGYVEQLKNIFDIYCHIYDRYQNGKMPFSNFQKMLLDGELINIKIKDNSNKDLSKNVSFISETGKENNLNSTNKKLDNSNTQEIIQINNQNQNDYNNDIVIINNENNDNNKKTDNNKSNENNINNDNIQNSNISLDKKKINSSQSINNKKSKKSSKPKLKLLDLDVIISKICGNLNLSEYQTKFSNNNYDTTYLKQIYDSNNIIDNYSTKTNKSYKIDFILFLKTLTLISLKMYPNEKNDINISMKQFLNNEIEDFLSNLTKKSLNFSQNNDFNNLFKLISTTDEIIQLINDISPLINSYFDFYTEINDKKEKLCNFNLFVHFFKDYEIYPLWINLSNLSDIFYAQIYKTNREKNNYLNISEKIDFPQFLECFVAIGLTMNSGDDFDMIDKVLFMIDKMFSDNYGKVIKKIKTLPTFKDDYYYYEKILKEKYPSYYERKYSNCNHRYDNKFYWVYEKNYGGDKNSQQIDFGELFNKEKVKFNDVFEELNNFDNIKKVN